MAALSGKYRGNLGDLLFRSHPGFRFCKRPCQAGKLYEVWVNQLVVSERL